MDPDRRIRRQASRTHGVVSRDDAHRAGLTDRQIRTRIGSGEWVRLRRDVFALAAAPATAKQQLLVATLAHRAAAFGPSAAWLHGAQPTRPATPHVGRSSRAGGRPTGVVLHQVRDLPDRDLVTVDSIRATSPTRTLIDLAATLDDDELGLVVARACRMGLTHEDQLVRRFLQLRRKGRNGIARMGRILAELDPAVALLESDLEVLLRRLIAAHGLPAPTPQFQVHVAGATYRLDLAYPDEMVAIEGDGFAFHSGREVFENDRTRQNALVLAGWTVLRFTWRQVCTQPALVAEQLRRALGTTASASASASGAQRRPEASPMRARTRRR